MDWLTLVLLKRVRYRHRVRASFILAPSAPAHHARGTEASHDNNTGESLGIINVLQNARGMGQPTSERVRNVLLDQGTHDPTPADNRHGKSERPTLVDDN